VAVSESSEPIQPPRPALEPGDRTLFLAALAGPLVWFSQLLVGIAIVGDLCTAQTRWPFHLVSGVALALTAGGVAACWTRRRALAGRTGDAEPRHALATAGAVLGAFFALVIVGLELPALVLHPCL
jgi:uncharacterized protein YqgC (DUF456 family)